jgi:hypothetical protein
MSIILACDYDEELSHEINKSGDIISGGVEQWHEHRVVEWCVMN